MQRVRLLGGAVLIGVAVWVGLLVDGCGSVERQFGRVLMLDGRLTADQEHAGWWGRLWLPVGQWRVEHLYRRFLHAHPAHARAMVAYGCFLADRHREDEAVHWWEKALATDPQLAVAYNNLGEYYSHSGRAADALRYLQKAYELAPATAVYHYNWALVCSMFRRDAQAVYGWDTEESLRRSLVAFHQARDLAPRDYGFASAYAEAFYYLARPDWEELGAAWQFCLNQPISELERQLIYGRVARVCMHQQRFDEARCWLAKMTTPEARSLRDALTRKMAALENSPPEPASYLAVVRAAATPPAP